MEKGKINSSEIRRQVDELTETRAFAAIVGVHEVEDLT